MLVAGLLMIGSVAAADGLFEAVGARLACAPFAPLTLLFALLGLVAIVTALLNLDTSVVFLTPVLVHAARRRALDERPFLYGAVFMSNAASLLLPGSNLTNLLVLRHDPASGADLGAHMLLAWLVACAITALYLAAVFKLDSGVPVEGATPALRPSLGLVAVITAALLVLALRDPALPVLTLGLTATSLRRLRPQVGVRTLAALFSLAVCVGTLARSWGGPEHLLVASGLWATAGIGAVTAVMLNNLPAAALLSAHAPPHPHALLVGLDLGPDLAASGSLSAVLWLQAARAAGAQPSLVAYSRFGLVLAPLTMAAALTALRVS